MAELPPKIPTSAPNPSNAFIFPAPKGQISHPSKFSSMGDLTTPVKSPWVDEFFDFSSTKRGLHRRAISDSMAECRDVDDAVDVDFERFDDEQFRSMFGDGMTAGKMTPPPSPVRESDGEEAREGAEEVESLCKLETGNDVTSFQSGALTERIVDPRRVKRIIANRQSAQRSRVRKLQYITDLERSVSSLQSEVSVLSPRVAFLDHQRLLLNVDNTALKQRIAALAQDKIFKDAHQEALKREVNRLRFVYHQQGLTDKENNNGAALQQQPLELSIELTDQKELFLSV